MKIIITKSWLLRKKGGQEGTNDIKLYWSTFRQSESLKLTTNGTRPDKVACAAAVPFDRVFTTGSFSKEARVTQKEGQHTAF